MQSVTLDVTTTFSILSLIVLPAVRLPSSGWATLSNSNISSTTSMVCPPIGAAQYSTVL